MCRKEQQPSSPNQLLSAAGIWKLEYNQTYGTMRSTYTAPIPQSVRCGRATQACTLPQEAGEPRKRSQDCSLPWA